jgi:radical SAM superfamily enzyme YgiQ (UPF0313 family)
MKVLFINPKISGGKPWIPIGMAYIAAYLRKHDIDVKIIDNNFMELNKKKLSSILNKYKPTFVGTGGMTVQCNDALKIGALVKSIDKNLTLVYGGVHFTFMPENGLKYGDLCVIGEGEETFLEICKESNLNKIKGIAFKEGNEIIITEQRPFIQNLDEIPFPSYDLLEVEKYEDRLITGEKAISIMTGRGCPYNCVFCASPQLWKRRVRFHSLDYVMSHIDFLVKNYNLKNLRIMDDTFTLSKKRVLEFCDKIEENGFKLNMTCLTNVKNADYEMFKRMREVGFSIIAFGVESGSNDILKMINKGITKDDVRNAVIMAKKAGLDTELLFMIGNIGENENTIVDSINFAKELNPPGSNSNKNTTYNWFQFATPFPGSKFYDIAKQYGNVITEDWDRYHHQEPVFIPKNLDKDTMIKLRNMALKETNPQRFSWIPQIIRRNILVRKMYKNILQLRRSFV